MILIADSGSTKTDWCLEDDGNIVIETATQGINPFHQDSDSIRGILNDELLPKLGDTDIEQVCFYGSGCRAEMIPEMQKLMSEIFPHSDIETNGDLLAAARAVCGNQYGIACIFGTGSNSCLYDGQNVKMNTSPLGYILGDEGSGAVLGKLFINAIFKGKLSSQIRDEYLDENKLTLTDIIDRVYRQPLANRFLASTSLFIRRHIGNETIRQLVVDNFRSFFKYNLSQYNRRDLKVGAIGSVAFYYSKELAEAAKEEEYTIGAIEKSPMKGLVKFHH